MKVSRADQHRVAVMEQMLDQAAHEELEAFVNEEFSKGLLGDGMLNAARALRSTKVTLFLATLGVANLPSPDDHAMWLVCYQSLAQDGESDGFHTLPEGLPIKWVVRQLLGTADQPSPQPGAAAADLLDAIELTIDQARLDLLEQLLQHLAAQNLETAAWLAIAKTLIDREILLRNQPGLDFYARSLEIVIARLPRDDDNHLVRSTLAAYAARSFLEANEPEHAKAVAALIAEDSIPYQHEHAVRMAEACCRAGEHLESITWLDKALALVMTPEMLGEFRQRMEQKKLQPSSAPAFDPDTAAQALIELQAALEPRGHRAFLVSGTLLGYAREGRLLSHDKDIDVGIMGEWVQQFDITNAILQSKKFYVETSTLGKEETYVIAIQHIATQTCIDVFLYRPHEGKLVTGVNNLFGYLQKFAFTPFDLQPIQFLGTDFYAPSDIDLNLRENYGEDWRTSDPDYISHLQSPSTVDVGGPIYQIVGRLSIYSAISQGKTEKLSRASALMERECHRAGGMAQPLLAQLKDLATRLDDIFFA